MADYNGYRIKRTHSLTPLTSVYEAEAVDGKAGRFALKVFHPPASTNLRRQYAIEGWLLAVERQQQSVKKDGAVLEVLAFGRCEEGAFAVYPWREHFLEPWIKTLGQKGNTLRALAECLFNAIEKWEKETGGPHGNLKPSNVFPERSGPLVGMPAKLSDPAFLPGAKVEERRLADLAAVGAMLATIVRRRPPGAWPIEEAPEWKALGHPGKAWLDFCNYLLNPQPGEGEVTLAKARARLKKVPKDANPVRTAALTLAALLVLSGVGVVTFARFGNPIYMPEQLQRLAQKIGNTRIRQEAPPAWAQLCTAWDAWLVDLQSNGPRLLRTEGLMDRGGALHTALTDFLARANELRPEALVPQAAAEKRLGVLGKTPPQAVLDELQLPSISERVTAAGKVISSLQLALEQWARWDQLRDLRQKLNERGFSRTADALAAKLPQARGTENYRQDTVRTLKLLNDISLDSTGTLPLVERWAEIARLSAEMLAVEDRIQKEMPRIIVTERLTDQPSLGEFADSLVAPLDEMRTRRKQYNDPQVVRERFLKESDLLKETNPVTAEDFPRWEKELFLYSLVPDAENPSKAATTLDASAAAMSRDAQDLEKDAPEGEAGQLPTFNEETFKREFETLNASLRALRARPIVRHDLPVITTETAKLSDLFKQLSDRLLYTLSLLKPETWLDKIKQDYGKFAESQKRWRAWRDTVVNTPVNSLKGPTNRERFRGLRANERRIKEWIDGLEGPEGFGALKMPNLDGTASADTIQELQRLEGTLRERAATAVGEQVTWTDFLPAPAWERSGPNIRRPLEQHSEWLGRVRDFAINLDQLGDHLVNGLGWDEGVRELYVLLRGLVGNEELKGRPGEWYDEAKQLEGLVNTTDRATISKSAAQATRLSSKLTAWRKLGKVSDWPSGPAEFDLDGSVIKTLRDTITRQVKSEDRRALLFQEMTAETRVRFNRAAMFAARAENQLTEMFNRMAGAGLKDADLEPRVAFNLQTWRFKRADRNEKKLDVLGKRRDAYVAAVKAIDGGRVAAEAEVAEFLAKLSAIELKDDPNRVLAPTPASAGWQEEITDEALGLVATWRNGNRAVRLEYSIVQPLDDTPPFFLARRAIAVGEFLDLMAGKKEAAEVLGALPDWAKNPTAAKPYDVPVAWRPRPNFNGLELNSSWIYAPTSTVQGILENTELRAANPALEQLATEKPSLRSPLQQVTPNAARIFAEAVLGARLPTVKEWRAALQATAAKPDGAHLRGPNFQKVWQFAKDFKVVVNTAQGPVDVTTTWRPSAGSFMLDNINEEGLPSASTDESRFWFRTVDDGPKSGDFINLLGNVSIFLTGDKPTEFYVAGGSVLSKPSIDFTQPQKVGGSSAMIGGRAGSQPYSDVGIRPAFDAPPGFKERYTLFRLVGNQKYLTL